MIRAIDKDVNPESAGQDILERLSSLGFKKRSSREPTPVASSEPVEFSSERYGNFVER